MPVLCCKALFTFRSETHSLNEELGIHSSRNNTKAYVFCEYESVEHVSWECSECIIIGIYYIAILMRFYRTTFRIYSHHLTRLNA